MTEIKVEWADRHHRDAWLARTAWIDTWMMIEWADHRHGDLVRPLAEEEHHEVAAEWIEAVEEEVEAAEEEAVAEEHHEEVLCFRVVTKWTDHLLCDHHVDVERPEAAAEEVEAVVVAVAVAVEDEEQVVEVEHPDECQRIGMKIDTKIAMRIAMKMTTMSLYDEDAVAAEAE